MTTTASVERFGDLISEAITEWLGERCPDYTEGCACCEAWKQYDDLKAHERAAPDLEAAARAICKGRGLDPDGCYFGAGSISTTGSTFECYQYNWQCYLGDARAALEAKP